MPATLSLERMTMLLERQTQLEQLDGLLAEAGRGRGRVALLAGEAGAGKTTLVEAFLGRAGDGARLLRSACEDLSIPDPLGPLYDLARDAQWALPQAIDHRQGQRLPLFSDALEIFEAKTGPSLLVIEDLHWADDATLDFVRFLGRRIVNTHILLLLTARTDRSEGQMRVRRALGEIPASSVVRIEVPLLSEAAVLSLADAAGRDGDAIYRATVGNAFFVTELLSAENETALPASVRDAVLARAERLSAGARSMLDAVSVFLRRADAWALQGLCGVASAGQLAECVSNGLLDDLGDGYAFRHEIARRAIEMALTTSQRRQFNQRALAALLENGEVSTGRLVHHAVEAHNLEAVRELAPIAARDASRVGAHRDAAGYCEAALRQADSLPLEDRATLYEKYAFECHLIGRIDAAIEAQAMRAACIRRRATGRRKGIASDGCRASPIFWATARPPTVSARRRWRCWKQCRPAPNSPWPIPIWRNWRCWPSGSTRRFCSATRRCRSPNGWTGPTSSATPSTMLAAPSSGSTCRRGGSTLPAASKSHSSRISRSMRRAPSPTAPASR